MLGIIVDLDGTVYRGDQPLAGAADALRRLRAAGHRAVFATNKSIARRADYVRRLAAMGIPADPADLVVANDVLAAHLAARFPAGTRVLAVGEEPLAEALAAAGLAPADASDGSAPPPEAVALGWDRGLTYAKLAAAHRAARAGAYIAATNPDATCPVDGGDVPDCGAVIAAVETAARRSIDAVTGKPSAEMARAAAGRIGPGASAVWVVGDRVDTDLRMARAAGMRAALVLTGVTSATRARRLDPRPDLVCADLAAFADRVLGR
ncbi:HAD-IIA family hydrolase [Nocardiopsis coralliicola]